jgi:hypothetical protein
MKRFFRDKRGDGGESSATSWDIGIKVFFTFLVLAVVLYLIIRFVAAFLGAGVDANVKNSFRALADDTKLLLDKKSNFEYIPMIFAYNDNTKYRVVAFNSAEHREISGYSECRTRSCLCLYKGDDALEKPKECRVFNETVIFHTAGAAAPQSPDLYSDYPAELGTSYSGFTLNTNERGDRKTDLTFDIYIEKYVANGRKHIFFGLLDVNFYEDQMDKRISVLGLCPDGSSAECIGMRRNSVIPDGRCFYDENNKICTFYKQGNLPVCPNGALSSICLCGDAVADPSSQPSTIYCVTIKSGKKISAVDCDEFAGKGCEAYCISISTTAGCDDSEQQYCKRDLCEISSSGCTVAQQKNYLWECQAS